MPPNPNKTPGSIPGCRAWSCRDSSPPLCSFHSGRTGAPPANRNHLIHGFYARILHTDDLQDLPEDSAQGTLTAEIALVRIALRRLLRMLVRGVTPGPDPKPLDAADYARVIGLTFQGAGALSRLLRANAVLSVDEIGMTPEENRMYDELSAELGIDL